MATMPGLILAVAESRAGYLRKSRTAHDRERVTTCRSPFVSAIDGRRFAPRLHSPTHPVRRPYRTDPHRTKPQPNNLTRRFAEKWKGASNPRGARLGRVRDSFPIFHFSASAVDQGQGMVWGRGRSPGFGVPRLGAWIVDAERECRHGFACFGFGRDEDR